MQHSIVQFSFFFDLSAHLSLPPTEHGSWEYNFTTTKYCRKIFKIYDFDEFSWAERNHEKPLKPIHSAHLLQLPLLPILSATNNMLLKKKNHGRNSLSLEFSEKGNNCFWLWDGHCRYRNHNYDECGKYVNTIHWKCKTTENTKITTKQTNI